MRIAVCLFAFVLTGCAETKRYSSVCDIPDRREAIGSVLSFRAMLADGGMEYPPMVVDPKCWRGLPADTREAPDALRKAFERPGRFNKFAVVSGRVELFNKEPWLHVTSAQQVRVDPPMNEAQEQAFFGRMVREGKAWTAAHPQMGAAH